MASWIPQVTDALWRNAVAVVPLALLAAAICRWVPCRASTKHVIWLLVLAWFVVPPVLPALSPAALETNDSQSAETHDDRGICGSPDTWQAPTDDLGRTYEGSVLATRGDIDHACTEEVLPNESCLNCGRA